MSNNIDLKKGLDIPIKGSAKPVVSKTVIPDTVAIVPDDFKGFTPRLLVKEGDRVLAGSPVLADKKRPEILITSPVSGTVKEIVRGDKRKLLEVRIGTDSVQEYVDFGCRRPESLSADEVRTALLQSGLWAAIIQRPYGILADPALKPKAIFISAFSTAPLAPDTEFVLGDEFAAVQAGVNALSKLTDGGVHVSLKSDNYASTPFHKLENAILHTFSGPHPAGNVGVQISHIAPIQKDETVWTVSLLMAAAIGRLFLKGKTSYAMFLMKAIQDVAMKEKNESVAFIMMNVKGTDLLNIDHLNERKDEIEEIRPVYKKLGMEMKPFQNVKYYYPYSKDFTAYTYEKEKNIKNRMEAGKAFQFKYLFETEEDKECLDLLFANIDDPNETIESIINYIISNGQGFKNVATWEDFKNALYAQTQAGKAKTQGGDSISVMSWRKFYRLFNKSYLKCQQMFTNQLGKSVRLRDQVEQISKNDVMVIDVAKLDEESQGFVFGDVMRAVYNLKLGSSMRPDEDIPDRIIIFIDELNKYASNDVPKSSPILRQLLDITERGRSLGIVLFGAEQFVSDIHKRVKGNCATQAFGRTNAIEITKEDFRFVPSVYKTMLTRLKQGEYIIQNPVFRSMLNIKFPKPIYKYYE